MFAKRQYVRSKKLMEAYRAIPCQSCGRDDGTVAGAHSNEARHGKGKATKSSDIYACSLCFTCHSAMDQGSKMSKQERLTMWFDAHCKTVRELVRRGLWPLDVPIPDIRQFN